MAKKIELEVQNLDTLCKSLQTTENGQNQAIKALNSLTDYWFTPDETNALEVAKNAKDIHELYYMVKSTQAKCKTLETLLDFAIRNLIKDPKIQEEFSLKAGAKTTKCTDMIELAERFSKKGYYLPHLFNFCQTLSSKKASEAFGLSEQAFLEEYGDIFETKQNQPTIQMNY